MRKLPATKDQWFTDNKTLLISFRAVQEAGIHQTMGLVISGQEAVDHGGNWITEDSIQLLGSIFLQRLIWSNTTTEIWHFLVRGSK